MRWDVSSLLCGYKLSLGFHDFNTPQQHFCFGVWGGRHFVEACGHGLGINERLIKEDQQEYHDEMKANYRDLARELSIIMHEQVRLVSVTWVLLPSAF